jgi:hypothetical protein
MSLNRLLSWVPFARRLLPQGRDPDGQASSGPFMVFFSFNLLTAVWGLMLLVNAVALIVFLLYTSGVAYFGSIDARDAEIQSINSAVDLGVLKDKAAFDVSQGYDNGATATWLCYIAVCTSLFMIVGSIAGLLLVRWIKRHLGTIQDDDGTAPMRASLDLLYRIKKAESESQMVEG